MTPWLYENKPFQPEFKDILLNHWNGFIYKITHNITGKSYIGKKNLVAFRNGRKFESDWKNYISSSETLNHDIISEGLGNYTREILCICNTPHELNYREVQQMFLHDVLYARLPDGSPAFYNQVIPGFMMKRP